mmetsp:Transcript_26995/g.70900  ORF Transcript_26995/g.70900 Transcript_26995/m.70900 type:complete len:102 (-) Transcript_26995:5-310(-)
MPREGGSAVGNAGQWEYDLQKWRVETTLEYINAHPRSMAETVVLLVVIVLIVAWLARQLYDARELTFAYGDAAPPTAPGPVEGGPAASPQGQVSDVRKKQQ